MRLIKEKQALPLTWFPSSQCRLPPCLKVGKKMAKVVQKLAMDFLRRDRKKQICKKKKGFTVLGHLRRNCRLCLTMSKPHFWLWVFFYIYINLIYHFIQSYINCLPLSTHPWWIYWSEQLLDFVFFSRSSHFHQLDLICRPLWQLGCAVFKFSIVCRWVCSTSLSENNVV